MSEITRIVRLSFEEDKVDAFLNIFEGSKVLIGSFEGCMHLQLMKDFHHSNVYYTFSKWSSHLALENYRQSDLFKKTWAKTKVLFDAKPLAYSLVVTENVPLSH